MKQIIFKSLVVRSLAFIMLMMCAVPVSAQYYMNVYKNDGQKYQFLVSDIDSVSITQDIINNSHNGYEYVDLGLPSGLKWATCNVGAESPEDYGDYFAWGETEPKSNYSWSTYKHCNNGSSSKLTKYNVSSSLGTVDNITTLELEDDAAHVNWGGAWRMPTSAEQDELREKCTWTWTTLNGIKGYIVTSKSNGNSIFLPAAGYRGGADGSDAGSYGDYWSSSLLSSGNPCYAYLLNFYSSYVVSSNVGSRYYGLTVRAVCLDTENIPTSYTISFNANGGEGEMSLFEIRSDQTLPLPICTFTRDGYEFIGWSTNADGSGTSYSNEQSITVAENLVLYAQWKEIPKITHNGYEYVDLGLSVKWATCNVGASSPEGYGDYFAWGETNPKSDYEWETYKFRTSGDSDDNVKFSKYNTDSDYGPIDNKTTLDSNDDAARVNWGGSWRMPTEAEQYELREKCTWTWTTLNGVEGYKVTSKSNGKSIFLPAAGYRGDTVYGVGSSGSYWSSSLCSAYPDGAYCLGFSSDCIFWYDRYVGRTVRAVCLDTENIPTSYTISFNANGGVGEMSQKYSAENLTLPANAFTYDGYVFVGWNTKADGTGSSYSDGQEISVKENITLYAQWKEIPKITHNGYEYVDLGLSVKWATCNVGASSPEGYGSYFAWGETSPKSDYDWDTYEFRTSGGDNWCNVKFSKYNTDSVYGPIDNKTALDSNDDAARVNWGGSWRMPTIDEQDELKGNCTWTWTTLNGIIGYKVTSKINGNSIFLPAAGSRRETAVHNAGSLGFYWSSSLSSGCPYDAFCLGFDSDDVSWDRDDHSRYVGHTVRAVCLDTENIPTSYTISFNANGGEGEMSLFEIWSDETPTLPICTFTRDGYEFIGWNTKADGSGASYGNEQSITVAENLVLYAQWKEIPKITHNGYEYVDLGLSVKWATCNVGAEYPEGYGSYFAWGETEPKNNYSWSTYKHCNNGSYYQFTKYNGDSSCGTVDNKTTLDLEDDAAHVNWGGGWRMPTYNEWDELKTQCTWKWITQNGVKGYKVTSKTNGNSIFLPAVGHRDGTDVGAAGFSGYYWSSLLPSSGPGPHNAYSLSFLSDSVNWGYSGRCFGYAVRAVCQ